MGTVGTKSHDRRGVRHAIGAELGGVRRGRLPWNVRGPSGKPQTADVENEHPSRRGTMRRRMSALLAGTTATAAILVIAASSTGGSGAHPAQRVTLMSRGPQAAPAALPDPLTELQKRASGPLPRPRNAVPTSVSPFSTAPPDGCQQRRHRRIPDRLGREAVHRRRPAPAGGPEEDPRSPQDRRGLEVMLRSSDDFPADDFWVRGGGNAVIQAGIGPLPARPRPPRRTTATGGTP